MAIDSLRRSLLWAVVVLVISMTGCASFHGKKELPPPTIEGPSCTLLYKDKRDQVRAAKIPLDGMMYVGQLLDEQRVLHKRRRNSVMIYRKSEDRPEPVRLEIELDGRKVREEFNYALFDGDQIVVAPDTSSAIDGLIGYLGPLARSRGQR